MATRAAHSWLSACTPASVRARGACACMWHARLGAVCGLFWFYLWISPSASTALIGTVSSVSSAACQSDERIRREQPSTHRPRQSNRQPTGPGRATVNPPALAEQPSTHRPRPSNRQPTGPGRATVNPPALASRGVGGRAVLGALEEREDGREERVEDAAPLRS